MAVRDDFTAGEVLAAADLNDTFASKVPYAYGTATPSTTVDGFVWYDENETPPAPKFWDGAAFQPISAPSGLVHVATESFSAVSSVSLNGCFSATYDFYKLIISLTPSASGSLRYRMRVSGADLTTSTYSYAAFYTFVSGTGSAILSRSASDTFIFATNIAASTVSNVFAEVANPFNTTSTGFSTEGVTLLSADPSRSIEVGSVNNATSYDGLTIFPSTGTMTGTIRVYGYANS